jgi:APA family basic amino acid/polyamine antiporter
MNKLFGPAADVLFSILIAFALFSSLSAFIIIGPRVYYSMAKDGLFFKSIARIHPRFHVPSNSILLQAAIAIVLVLSGTFEQILSYMGFALGIFPILTVLAVFRLRRRNAHSIKLRGFPLPQIIYIFAGFFVLILAYFERPVESSIALGTVALGIPAYFYFKSRLKYQGSE